MPGLKQKRPFNYHFSQPQNQRRNQPRNPDIPSDSSFDPLQTFEKSTKFQKIFQEIRQMSRMEFCFFLLAIDKLRFGN